MGAITVISVLAMLYAAVVSGCCRRNQTRNGGSGTFGAERGVNYEYLQALLTNILQKHWEWQRKNWVLGFFF